MNPWVDASLHFENVARARKVAAMLALVPPARSTRDVVLIARHLSAFTEAQRAELARQAKVQAPSSKTWRALLRAVWARGADVQQPQEEG